MKATVIEWGKGMTEAATNAFTARSAATIRHLRRMMRMLVPYKHELTAIAEQLGCKDKPFTCWLEIDRMKARVARADKLERDLRELRASIKDQVATLTQEPTEKLRVAEATIQAHASAEEKAKANWLTLGFDGVPAPEGADMLVWLMSRIEAAEARLVTEKASTRAFQAAVADLLRMTGKLNTRIAELEPLQGAQSAR